MAVPPGFCRRENAYSPIGVLTPDTGRHFQPSIFGGLSGVEHFPRKFHVVKSGHSRFQTLGVKTGQNPTAITNIAHGSKSPSACRRLYESFMERWKERGRLAGMGHYTQFHSTNLSANTIAHMTAVFEELCAKLGLTPKEDQLCEVVAQEIRQMRRCRPSRSDLSAGVCTEGLADAANSIG